MGLVDHFLSILEIMMAETPDEENDIRYQRNWIPKSDCFVVGAYRKLPLRFDSDALDNISIQSYKFINLSLKVNREWIYGYQQQEAL